MIDFLLKVKELFKTEPKQTAKYTDDELMIRLKVFIGGILALTLFGIVFVVLYSLIFVTQPLNAISPIDQKFFELIIPIATFLTGTLSGIMLAGGDKDAQKEALKAANKGWEKPPAPTPVASSFGSQSLGGGFGSAMPVNNFNNFAPVPQQSTGWGAVADTVADTAMNAFGTFSGQFGTGQPSGIVTARNGKPGPMQPEHPEI